MTMTDDVLTAAFLAHKEGQTKFTRRMAIAIGRAAGASPREIVQRLERMRLLRAGSWRWFVQNGGITKDHIAEVEADIRAARRAA